jgi:hypothetical protein
MKEREEGECPECSGQCDEDMSSSRSITRRDLGSPVVSTYQLYFRLARFSSPNGSITVEVVCETPTEITELPSASFSIDQEENSLEHH